MFSFIWPVIVMLARWNYTIIFATNWTSMKSLRVKIGHHEIGAGAEIGQNWIWGDWGSKKLNKRWTSFMDVPCT